MFAKVLEQRPKTREFLRELHEVTDYAVYGGAIRDLFLYGPEGVTGDIDIVTELQDQPLREWLKKYQDSQRPQMLVQQMGTGPFVDGEQTRSRGMFGGWKVLFRNEEQETLDIWAFERTLELLDFDEYDDPWQALADRTDFSCNCVALVIPRYYEPTLVATPNVDGYLDLLLNKKVIDINNPRSIPSAREHPGRALAARAVKQITTKKLLPTQRMADFLTTQLVGKAT